MAKAESNRYLWDIDNPRGYANAMGRYKTQKELAFLLDHVRGEKLRILEIGGGSGRFAVPLTERGHDVTVADKSKEALDILRARNPRISRRCGDFLAETFDDPFDMITGMESVQYFTSIGLEELFSKVHSLLRPNGHFVFTELNRQSWRFALRSLGGEKKVDYNIAAPKDYETALRRANFTDIHMEGFLWMPFTTSSDSSLVPLFVKMERMLRLNRWVAQSPWLLISARRPS